MTNHPNRSKRAGLRFDVDKGLTQFLAELTERYPERPHNSIYATVAREMVSRLSPDDLRAIVRETVDFYDLRDFLNEPAEEEEDE